MSKIDDMIVRLSPDGVEYRELGEVCHYPKTRIVSSTVDQTAYVGVENMLPNKAGKEDAVSVPSSEPLIEYLVDDILIGNIRPYLRKIWRASARGATNGDVLVIRTNEEYAAQIDTHYLYYVLSSEDFFQYDTMYSRGAKMPRGDKKMVLKFRIPIPPLEIQKEIVRVLDSFTELEARRKQYAYYRDELLTFRERERESKESRLE